MDCELPDALPEEKKPVAMAAVDGLASIPGVSAIALAGSYARGTARPDSDVDLGILYSEASPFQIAAIRDLARELSADVPPVVTEFYEWGPWVNGGAWIHTSVGRMDFIYRSLEHIERTIEDASRGVHQHHFNQQPTYGYYSVAALGEISSCVPLFDPAATVAKLKKRVESYPRKLRDAIVADDLWAAEFTFRAVKGFAARGDIYNTVGCLTRITAYLTQVLYALNDTYFISDKAAPAELRDFRVCPRDYVDRVSEVLATPGTKSEALSRSVASLEQAWREVVDLAGDRYEARHALP